MLPPSRLLCCLALLLPSCVERELTISTVPADADIYLDGKRIGQSPVTVPFTFYGTREIVARKPGYFPERQLEEMTPPPYQEAPEDLYYETLTRDLYVDSREYHYVLTPLTPESTSRRRVGEAAAEVESLRHR